MDTRLQDRSDAARTTDERIDQILHAPWAVTNMMHMARTTNQKAFAKAICATAPTISRWKIQQRLPLSTMLPFARITGYDNLMKTDLRDRDDISRGVTHCERQAAETGAIYLGRRKLYQVTSTHAERLIALVTGETSEDSASWLTAEDIQNGLMNVVGATYHAIFGGKHDMLRTWRRRNRIPDTRIAEICVRLARPLDDILIS